MNKKFLLFEGKRREREETVAEVTDHSRRVYDDLYGESYPAPSHKSPNTEKIKLSIFSQKYPVLQIM